MRFYITLLLLIFSIAGFTQTLFTYGPYKVDKDEFLRAYNKNKNAAADQQTALREYLDLYIKFKLKVKAAQLQRLDTIPSLVAEYNNFRTTIEESYLDDDKTVQQLIQEAFERSQQDIHVEHLYIPVVQPQDSSKILAQLSIVKQKLAAKETFPAIAKYLQDAGITASTGDVGFITVFSLPYEYESIIYSLPEGGVSAPYHARNGFHIFRNLGKRKAVGKIKVAQILIALPAEATDEQRDAAKKTADSVYAALKGGASFEELAKTVSNDKMTYMTGGVMPEFGTGKYDQGFELRAFSLQKNGDFTEPFLTSFGYHIVKRLDQTAVPADSKDPNTLFNLKQQVQQDSRMQLARQKFLADIFKKTGFKKNPGIDYKLLWAITDSSLINFQYKIPAGKISSKTILHSFAKGNSTVDDWIKFVREFKIGSGNYKGESYGELMDKFIASAATAYYRKKLEDFSPEFKYQLQEFKDGNMLFEVMERNVWDRASNDSSGLKRYYQQHKTKYLWEPSADAILITAATEKLADETAEAIRKGKDYNTALRDNSTQLQSDSGRYELSQLPVKDRTNFEKGIVTAPVVNGNDGTASFAIILKVYPGKQQRSFEEARGLVINDYQAVLEQSWIESLKKKYPVKINEAVFKTM